MKRFVLLLFSAALLLSGCQTTPSAATSADTATPVPTEEIQSATSSPEESQPTAPTEEERQAALTASLGDLEGQLSQADQEEVETTFSALWEAYCDRVADGQGEMSQDEIDAMRVYSQLLDSLTATYIGTYAQLFGEEYAVVDELIDLEDHSVDLADYPVRVDGNLGEGDYFDAWEDYSYTDADVTLLWNASAALLPEDALSVFDYFSIFTDGEGDTLGYVTWGFNSKGDTLWYFALDPADAGDAEGLQSTILHEYFHYLSMNENQVDYEGEVTGLTYADAYYEIYSHEDSYLNLFYQAFWPSIWNDERLAYPESNYFFLRHYSSFYDEYAVTDPSEDIAECFTGYVMLDADTYQVSDPEEWQEKLAWFDQFPELKEFRQTVRQRLGLEDE